MRKNIILVAGAFMLFLCAQSVRAEMFSFSKSMGGTISDVRPDAISLTPTSASQSNPAPIDLEINDSTKLKDLRAVTDLKKGDAVQVKYKEQDGKKVAVQVEKDAKAQAQADQAQGATVTTTTTGAAVGATTGSVKSDTNSMGSQNTAEDQLYKTNQGTNQAPANKQDPGMDESGAESSSQFQSGTSEADQINQGSSTTVETTTYPSGESTTVDQSDRIRATDPTAPAQPEQMGK